MNPVHSDEIVSLNLLRQPKRGWMASIVYDEEGRGAFRRRNELVRFVAEIRF